MVSIIPFGCHLCATVILVFDIFLLYIMCRLLILLNNYRAGSEGKKVSRIRICRWESWHLLVGDRIASLPLTRKRKTASLLFSMQGLVDRRSSHLLRIPSQIIIISNMNDIRSRAALYDIHYSMILVVIQFKINDQVL